MSPVRFRTGLWTLLLCCLFGISSIFAEEIDLEWEPNSEPDIVGYTVYYAPVENPPSSIHISRSRVKLNLVPGVTYFLYVTASNSAGMESDPSERITYTVPGPTVTPARILTVQHPSRSSDGTLTIMAAGTPGSVYRIEGTLDLINPNWVVVGYIKADALGRVIFRDPFVDATALFYRVGRLLPNLPVPDQTLP